eukprot:8723385-Ditylum_brightwellii.AAC.1
MDLSQIHEKNRRKKNPSSNKESMVETDKKCAWSMKVPTFGGEQKGYQIWQVRFRAYIFMCGFFQSIQNTKGPKLPTNKNDTVPTDDTAMSQTHCPTFNP